MQASGCVSSADAFSHVHGGLELLVVTWAMKKYRIHLGLHGLEHFELVVDHKALVTILDKHRLDDLDNTRLQKRDKRRRRSFHSRHAGRKEKIIDIGCAIMCTCL